MKFKLLIPLFLLFACSSPKPETDFLTASVSKQMNNLQMLPLAEEIEGVDYIPLEMTSDNASLIDGIACYTITDDAIYVLPTKEQRVVQYDREGHFIKTLISFGQGPNEFSSFITNIQVDEENNKLYLFATDRFYLFTLQGELIEQKIHDYQTIFHGLVGNDCLAAVSIPYIPFQKGSFGIGIFTEEGDTVITKNDFYSSLVPKEQTGFTTRIAVSYPEAKKSVLFKTGGNDTLFQLSEKGIQPVCALNLHNSDQEIMKAIDIANIKNIHDFGDGNNYFISDLFETSKRYYLRLRNNDGHLVASIDKQTGETYVEKCVQPVPLRELAGVSLQHGMLGTRSYQGFPIWGNVLKDNLVQIVTPVELEMYQSLSEVTIPEALKQVDEEGNPIFIFYKLKK